MRDADNTRFLFIEPHLIAAGKVQYAQFVFQCERIRFFSLEA